MATIDELLEQAKRLTPRQRRELRDRLAESLKEGECPATGEGPYASLLRSAGSGHAVAPDIARRKSKHLAEIYATKRTPR